jgi:glycosyltransferase involved in cell wall biosynthesis
LLIITDILGDPYDEGAKSATRDIIKIILKENRLSIIHINQPSASDIPGKNFNVNPTFLNYKFLKYIKSFEEITILYIPQASITISTFFRAFIIKLFTLKKVIILSFQPRIYNYLEKLIISRIKPECIIAQSKTTCAYLNSLGQYCKPLPLGVNTHKFKPIPIDKRSRLRSHYNYDDDKTIMLHVGHLCPSRNVEWLIDIKRTNPNIEILFVVSSYNNDGEFIQRKLEKYGIRIIHGYKPKIEHIYCIADYYIFPVLNFDGAIETPLSVLEAMACNLPIITTEFGSLPDTFKEDKDFHYVTSVHDIIKILDNRKDTHCSNREKIKNFTWDAIARNIIDIVEK